MSGRTGSTSTSASKRTGSVPRHHRCPPRRDEGARRGHRRLPGVEGLLGGVLRDLQHRGMRAPVLAVGDGALGFWAALRDVFPETNEQRCWVHKMANVLDALPKSIQPAAQDVLERDPRRRGPRSRPGRQRELRQRVRGEVAEGRREDPRRPRRAARVLRLPGRALGPSEDDEPDRVNLRDGAAPDQGDQGTGLSSRRPGDGVQAPRGRPGPLAGDQRTEARRTRACRSEIQKGGVGREIDVQEEEVAA